MAGRTTNEDEGLTGLRRARGRRDAEATERAEAMSALLDHCLAAKTLADKVGDRFLSYMLAMTIQESRVAIRRGSTRR